MVRRGRVGHYQYRFNEFFDALAGVLDLVHGAGEGAHALVRIVVAALLELNAGARLVLDLLDHVAVLADDDADGRARHRHLDRLLRSAAAVTAEALRPVVRLRQHLSVKPRRRPLDRARQQQKCCRRRRPLGAVEGPSRLTLTSISFSAMRS